MKKLLMRNTGVTLCLLFFFIFAGTTAAFALPRIAAPILVSPTDQILLVNLPRTTTLAWTPVAGAASYTVDVYYKATATATYPTTATFTITGITVAEVELTGADLLTADGYYKWTVTTIPTDTTKFEDSNPSSPFHFIYSTIFTLETPARISPANQAHFHGDGTSPQMTLQWSARPAVGANGYEVYVEGPYDSKTMTWPAATTPYPVPVATSGGSPALTYQNSSYSFTPPAKGAYRWAARSLGDGGKTTNDSPAPEDNKPADWNVFFFQK